MSKNQGGIVQYVDFHRDEAIKIIAETKKTSKRLKKTPTKQIKQETIVIVEQKTAELIQFISSSVESKSAVQQEVKPVAIKKTAKSVKKTDVKNATAVKSKKEVAKVEEIVEAKTNIIRAFFEKNKEYYDIAGILDNTRDSRINVIKDITNEQIHKKAVNAIIKSVKSSRKFKLEKAS